MLPSNWRRTWLSELTLQPILWNPHDDARDRIRYVDVSGVSREELRVVAEAVYSSFDAPSRARKVVQAGEQCGSNRGFTNEPLFAPCPRATARLRHLRRDRAHRPDLSRPAAYRAAPRAMTRMAVSHGCGVALALAMIVLASALLLLPHASSMPRPRRGPDVRIADVCKFEASRKPFGLKPASCPPHGRVCRH